MIENVKYLESRIELEFVYQVQYKNHSLCFQKHLRQQLKKILKQNFSIVSEKNKDSHRYFLALKASPSIEKNQEKYTMAYFEKNLYPELRDFIVWANNYVEDKHFDQRIRDLHRTYDFKAKTKNQHVKFLDKEIREKEEELRELKRARVIENVKIGLKELGKENIPEKYKTELKRVLEGKMK